MKCFVTGGAGFIGSNMVDKLLLQGHRVTVNDNFSTGLMHFLNTKVKRPALTIVEGDLLDKPNLIRSMKDHDMVFHFAANADVRYGFDHPSKDFNQNTLATFNVLEAMRVNDIKKIMFSSTSAIYGDTETTPTPESAPFPQQTSLYGASKLACEGMIQAYCAGYDMQSWIFRFVSILGERYTHGHVFDFYKQISEHPKYLNVLGDGKQKKSYLYVQDCIEGILCAIGKSDDPVNIFNLGTTEYCEVNISIKYICEYLDKRPELRYSGGKRGWIGDNPLTYLDTSKIRKLGWKPKYTIQESIIKTVEYLKDNPVVLERE